MRTRSDPRQQPGPGAYFNVRQADRIVKGARGMLPEVLKCQTAGQDIAARASFYSMHRTSARERRTSITSKVYVMPGVRTRKAWNFRAFPIHIKTRRQVQPLVGRHLVQSLGFLGNNIGVLDLYSR
jgi:hypothetical protein